MNPSIGFSSNGSGLAVVALHSSMSSKLQWARLAKRLEQNYRFIAIDLHGYGATDFPSDPAEFSLRDEMAVVNHVLRNTIGSEAPFHLVGHSYGGGAALRFAHEQPHRILSLSLYEPTMFCLLEHGSPERAEICRVIDAIIGHSSVNPEAAARTFIDYWNGVGSFDTLPPDRRAAAVKRVAKVSLDFKAMINDPLTIHDCRRMDLPVCLMSGRSSPKTTRRIVETLHATFPDVMRHDLDAGHMGPVTHADQINDIISDFFDQMQWQPMQLAVGT
jgi:pimeloyl-ACP methyl ester carboxylesterase